MRTQDLFSTFPTPSDISCVPENTRTEMLHSPQGTTLVPPIKALLQPEGLWAVNAKQLNPSTLTREEIIFQPLFLDRADV